MSRSLYNIYRLILIVGLALIAFSSYQPQDSKSQIIANSDPRMALLADNSYMTESGKIIFLKTKPELVDSQRIELECSSQAKADIPLELGCFIPSQNKIYLRDLPARFDSYESVVAVHEMLHAAYFLNEPDAAVIQELSNIKPTLEKHLSLYQGLSAEETLAEAHSFAPTVSRLESSVLDLYFAQFIYDHNSVVQLHENYEIDLQNMQTELSNFLSAAETWNTAANQSYANHSAAASYGDAANSEYYFRLYVEQHNTYNQRIQEYNTKVDEYNSLIEALNGRKLETISA